MTVNSNQSISRALVVGGGVGLRHLNNLKTLLPDLDICLLSRYSKLENKNLEINVISDLAEAILFKPEITIIANPATLHSEMVSSLAPTGTAFFIEKPLAASVIDAERIKKQTDTYSSLVMVGYNLRFSPSLCFLKNLIDEKEFGKVISVRSDVGQDLRTWRPGVDYKNSVSAQKLLGGGVLLELSHEIDYLSWIFGDIQHVNSMVGMISQLDADVEDFASIHLVTKSHVPISLTMDFFRQGKSRECVVVFENVTLKWDGIAGSVSTLSSNGEWEILKIWARDLVGTYTAEMKYFLDCIFTGAIPQCNLESAIKTIKVIEEIKSNSKVLNRSHVRAE